MANNTSELVETGVERVSRIVQHRPSLEMATALQRQRERVVPTGEIQHERLRSNEAGRERKSLSRARRMHRPARETPRPRAGTRQAPRFASLRHLPEGQRLWQT